MQPMKNLEQIKRKLSPLQIEELAWETGFHKRCSGKVDAENFLLSFFRMMQEGKNTLWDWALRLSEGIGQHISLQGLHSRLQFRHVPFARRLLEESLRLAVLGSGTRAPRPACFKHFQGVYLEDSTCVKLPANVEEFFGGNGGWNGAIYPQARIQLCLSLFDNQYTHIELTHYRKNDHSFAHQILSRIQRGWLCIRDLGYWNIQIFQALAEKGAFFLSRLKPRVKLLDVHTQQPIELLDKLKRCERAHQRVLDMKVLLGAQTRMPVRLVAVEVPQQVYQQRLRKAKKNRDSRLEYTEQYLKLLRWNLFVTNVPPEVWTWQHIQRAYACRWRIETIFKCWKSNLDLQRLFAGKQSMTPARVMITFYLYLVWVSAFFTRYFQFFLHRVYERKRRFVSMLKFADFFKTRFLDLLLADNLDKFTETVADYCGYARRRSRCNFMENLYMTWLA